MTYTDLIARLKELLSRAHRLVPVCHSRWHKDATVILYREVEA